MPFRLINAPVTFQGYINNALGNLVNTCYIVYLDNILVYLETEEKYIEHLI